MDNVEKTLKSIDKTLQGIADTMKQMNRYLKEYTRSPIDKLADAINQQCLEEQQNFRNEEAEEKK